MSIINCLDKHGAKLDSLGRKGARHDTASAQDLNPWGILTRCINGCGEEP